MTQDLSEIARLYAENLKTHGIDSKSVGWPTEESQLLRFHKLVEVMDHGLKTCTINDLGCGYGALYLFLKSLPKVQIEHFYGYDISDEMLDAARKKIPDEKVSWLHRDCLETKADYSFASGIFNVRFQESTENWERYVKQVLHNLNAHSERGFSFNLLSSYVDWKEDILYYADPAVYFDYCKTHFSKRVSLLHDYPLYEWTILVKKED